MLYNPIPLKYLPTQGVTDKQVIEFSLSSNKWVVADNNAIIPTGMDHGDILIYDVSNGEFTPTINVPKTTMWFTEFFNIGTVNGNELDIFIDPSGNDTTGEGTEINPFATLGHVIETLNANKVYHYDSNMGITIKIGAGAYVFQTPITLYQNGIGKLVIEAFNNLDKPILNFEPSAADESMIRCFGDSITFNNLEFRNVDMTNNGVAIYSECRNIVLNNCGVVRQDEVTMNSMNLLLFCAAGGGMISDAYTVDNGIDRALTRLVDGIGNVNLISKDNASVTTDLAPITLDLNSTVTSLGTAPSFDAGGDYWDVSNGSRIYDTNGDKVS